VKEGVAKARGGDDEDGDSLYNGGVRRNGRRFFYSPANHYPAMHVPMHRRSAMKLTLLLLSIVCSLLLSSCASTSGTFQNRERIALIKSWKIVYSSRVLTTSRQFTDWETSDRSEPVTRTRSELQFPRSLLSILKNKFNIPLIDDTSQVQPQMHLEAGVYPDGEITYLDVKLYDSNNEWIAHTRVFNERQHENTFRYTGAFAEYAADKIAELVDAH
jgi:hypothetical protein